MAVHEKQSSDMGAAFTGLIGGAIFIGAIMYGIVLWTNNHFEQEKAAPGSSGAVTERLRVG